MDGGYLSRRRARKDITAASKLGGCDFCYQKNVKIKSLTCQNHFYCQVCEQFCPKIRKGDFTCRKCSERTRMLEDQNRQRVDDFYVKQEGLAKPRGFEEIIFSIDGSNIITFDDSDDDMEGNNTEWDHLLESLTDKGESSPKPKKSPSKEDTEDQITSKTSENQKSSKNQKSSTIEKPKPKLELVIPTTQNSLKISSSGKGELPKFSSLDSLGVTGHSIKPEPEQPSSTFEVASFPDSCARDTKKSENMDGSVFPPGGPFDSDSLSERGTSPVKRPPKIVDAGSWLGLSGRDDESVNSVELFTIEGPSYGREKQESPDVSRDGSAFERDLINSDDFWDF